MIHLWQPANILIIIAFDFVWHRSLRVSNWLPLLLLVLGFFLQITAVQAASCLTVLALYHVGFIHQTTRRAYGTGNKSLFHGFMDERRFAMTGAVCTSRSNQMLNASAACSTSMPSPSATEQVVCSLHHELKVVAPGPYTMS